MDKKIKTISQTRKVLAIILVLNWIIAFIKIAIGMISNSGAVLANGLESFADGASNIVGLIALKNAAAPPDADHPYGHGKFETFATAIIGSLLLVTGIRIMYTSGQVLINYIVHGIEPVIDSDPILVVVLTTTLVANIFIVYFETKKGKELKSSILIADATHTKTDLFSTAAVIISFFIAGKFPVIDPIMSIIVALIIFHAAYGIFIDIANVLADKKRINPEEIEQLFKEDAEYFTVTKIRSRGVENQVFIDLVAVMDPSISLLKAHENAEYIENKILENHDEVVDVLVHMEPLKVPFKLNDH